MELIKLFKNPKSWIIEINNRVTYSQPIIGNDGLYHYLYCWVNMDTQWCYLGLHNSPNPINEEGYLGSCGNDHYWNSRDKHEFQFIILDYYLSEDELLVAESQLISEDLIMKFSEKGIFNLKVGGYAFSESARLNGHTKETVTKFIESNKLNHNGRLAWNTYEASIGQNQQKLINGINDRINLIKKDNLEINPYNYYYIKLLDHHDREIQRHIESICNRLYDDPPITSHENWDPTWTKLFTWFDNEDNWNSIQTSKFNPY